MSELREAVREIIEELDPDGAGFRSSEATGLLYNRAENEVGPMPPLTSALVRMGSSVAIRSESLTRPHLTRTVHAVVAAAVSPQSDMADLAEDFGWLDQHTALEEGSTAVRKVIHQLTRPETLQVIALKRRKAAQAAAMAGRLQLVIDAHPIWAKQPELTLGDIVGLRTQ